MQQCITRSHRQSRCCRVLPHDFFVCPCLRDLRRVGLYGAQHGAPRAVQHISGLAQAPFGGKRRGGKGGDGRNAACSCVLAAVQASGGLFFFSLVSGVRDPSGHRTTQPGTESGWGYSDTPSPIVWFIFFSFIFQLPPLPTSVLDNAHPLMPSSLLFPV